jgi:hypothetical protein
VRTRTPWSPIERHYHCMSAMQHTRRQHPHIALAFTRKKARKKIFFHFFRKVQTASATTRTGETSANRSHDKSNDTMTQRPTPFDATRTTAQRAKKKNEKKSNFFCPSGGGGEANREQRKNRQNQIRFTVSENWAAAGAASRAISVAIISDKRTFEGVVEKIFSKGTGSLFFFFFSLFSCHGAK